MDKKTVAIVMGPIYLGGAERALINMLKHFDYTNYRVVLWICGEEQGNEHDFVAKDDIFANGRRADAKCYLLFEMLLSCSVLLCCDTGLWWRLLVERHEATSC